MSKLAKKLEDKCLICGGKLYIKTECIHQESYCLNGHVYHLSPINSEVHEGISWHENCCNSSTGCCKNPKVIGKYKIING